MAMPTQDSQSISGTWQYLFSVLIERYHPASLIIRGDLLWNKNQTLLALAVIYVVALALAKLAIIMLYYRLLKSLRTWKYVLWVLAGCICISSTALVLAVILACHPIQEGWSDSLSNTNACSRRPGIANVVSDVMLILVPIVSLWRLHIPWLQKIGVICLCGIGCLLVHVQFVLCLWGILLTILARSVSTVIISIARLVTLIPFSESNDQPHQLGLTCLLMSVRTCYPITSPSSNLSIH